jgi:excisionase family DNA binding protein
MDSLLNPRELASILNVKVGTIYSWLSRKVDLPPSIKVGGSTRWEEADVKAWIVMKKKERRRRRFEE